MTKYTEMTLIYLLLVLESIELLSNCNFFPFDKKTTRMLQSVGASLN